MTRERMLSFTQHYKETIQDRLMILMTFCYKFIGVHVCQNIACFDKVIAKIKCCSFFYSQCIL